MTTTTNNNEKWYSKEFAIIPLTALLDKRMGPQHLKVLIALAHHANEHGLQVFPSRERIAEMCDFYLKGKPNVDHVSALISNPNHSVKDEITGEVLLTKNGKPKKTKGPGLVELGYVEKLGQRGENQTQAYRLMTPKLDAKHQNKVTERKMSNADYKAKRQGREEIEAEKEIARQNARIDAGAKQSKRIQEELMPDAGDFGF